MKKIILFLGLALVLQIVLTSCSRKTTPERAAERGVRRGQHL